MGPSLAWGATNGSGVFSAANIGTGNQDGTVGLSTNKTYQTANNVNGPALTINGVAFSASTTLTTGPNYSLGTLTGNFTTNTSGTANNGLTGQLGVLATTFAYNGTPATFTLNNLTVGQTYALTYYNVGFGAAGGRIMTSINASDGGSIANFDENMGDAGVGNVLRYTFVAQTVSEVLTFTPQTTGNTYHFYGFSNEQVFNNTYGGGANWTTPTWAKGVPSTAGSNALFPSAGSATTVNLNTAETVGHIQFQGTSAYTISGGNLLTLQADIGGTSVLSALAGTHTIATDVSLQNNVVTFGPGTIVLTGSVSASGSNITVSSGTLKIGDGSSLNGSFDGDIIVNSTTGGLIFSNPTATSYNGALSGTGNVTKSGAGDLTLNGFPTPQSASGGTFTISTGNIILTSSSALQNFVVNRANATDLSFASGLGTAALGGLNDAFNLAMVDAGSTPLSTLTLGNNGPTTATFSGSLSGAGTGIVKNGSNLQVFSGTNTYTGTTEVAGGMLEVTRPAALPGYNTAGQIIVDGGATLTMRVGGSGEFVATDIDAILSNSTVTSPTTASLFGFDTTGGNFTYNGDIANHGAALVGLTKLGGNTLTLGGTNTYTGPTLVSNGAILLNNTNAAQNSTVTVSVNNGLQFGTGIGTFTIGALAGSGNVALADSGAAAATLVAGGNNATTSYTGVLSGAGGLAKAGTGTLTLGSGASSYTGPTTINGGVLSVGTLASGGANSSIGASSNAAANLVLNGGTLQYTGAATTTDRGMTLGQNSGTIDSSGSGALNISSTAAVPNLGAGARTLTLTGSNTGANTFAGSLSDQSAANFTNLTKAGAGTWILTGSSSYTGVTTFGGGITNVSGLTDYGVAGPLGARTAGQEGASNVGLHFTGGTLQYTGSTPQSTNRQIRILGSATGVTNTIDASGSAPSATLSFTFSGTNTDFFDTVGIRTLQLTGSNTGDNLFNIAISNQATNATTLIKSGTGKWILGGNMSVPNNGSNGYTGGTFVQNGTLQLASTASLNSGGAVTLGSGGTSGTFVLGDAAGPVSQTVSALSVAGGTTNAVVGGNASNSTLTINYTNTSGPDTYTGMLGGTTGNANNLNLVKSGAGTVVLSGSHHTYAGTTAVTAGTLQLSAGTAPGLVAHYTFDSSNVNDTSGNANNGTAVGSPTFVTGVGGTGKAINFNGNTTTPQYATVPFSASLAQTNSGTYTVSFWENINSSTQNANAAFFSTRNATSQNTFDVQYKPSPVGVHGDIGNGAATWLTTGADAAAAISPGVWNMITYVVTPTGYTIYFNGNSVATGNYSGTPQLIPTGNSISLGGQKAGGANFTNFLNGAIDEVNVFSTALTAAQISTMFNGGGIAGTNILPTTTPLSIASGAILDMNGVTQTVASISDITGGGGSITNSAANLPVTLTINPASGATTFSGTISDTSAASAISVTKSGAGTQVLAGANSYRGVTTIAGGVLQLGVNNAIPSIGGLLMQSGSLNSGGHSDNLGTTTIAGAANIQFGATSDSGNVLTVASFLLTSGNLTLTNWDGNSTGNGPDQLLVSSGTPSASVLNAITFINPDVNGVIQPGTFAATTVVNGSNVEIVPGAAVPEPATAGLLSMAAIGLLARRRRISCSGR
jgi:fibronectin-binding autotransporter adhesin